MSYRKLAKGESLISAIERDYPELSGWWQDLANPEVQRCDVCKQLNLDNLAKFRSQVYTGVKHHKSWAALKAAAVAGCQLCKLFYFVKVETDKRFGDSFDDSLTEQLYITMDGSLLEVHAKWISEIQLEICSGKDWPQDIRGYQATRRLEEEDPASEVAFARAHRWIENCRSNHPNCVVNNDVALPTRVLDYRTCTTETFEELKNGISISRLPKTFQDAIIVNRNLGIQYLWIDSLCIMQDSREDWSCESARMSEVYGNSFLTILASTAQNSEQGFLGHRDPQHNIKTKFFPHLRFPELWTWARWPGTFRDPRAERKIGNRAWAFQEYLLPSRILEYAPERMEWHCNSASFKESNLEPYQPSAVIYETCKALMWILSLPGVGQPRINDKVPTHPRFAHSEDLISIYNRWYELVRVYSARELTFEADRLPAISGIARRIQEISGDSYMAGLWGNDLGAGLCWRMTGIGDVRQPSTYRAPSWSWASLEGCITYSIPENYKLTVNLLDFKIVADANNPLGEVSSGYIVILGLLRKLQIVQGTVSPGDVTYDKVGKGWPLQLKSDGEHYTEEVILLQLLAEGYDPKPEMMPVFTLHGIVLERVAANGDVYRRIGAYSFVDIDTGMEYAGLGGWTESTITII